MALPTPPCTAGRLETRCSWLLPLHSAACSTEATEDWHTGAAEAGAAEASEFRLADALDRRSRSSCEARIHVKQRVNRFNMPAGSRVHERVPASVVGCCWVGSTVKERAHHLSAAIGRRERKRGATSQVLRVYVGTALYQHHCRLRVRILRESKARNIKSMFGMCAFSHPALAMLAFMSAVVPIISLPRSGSTPCPSSRLHCV